MGIFTQQHYMMFIPLLTILAVFLGSWMLAIVFESSGTKSSAQPSILIRKVSLWSLLLFIFCPEFSAPISTAMSQQKHN